MEHREHSIWPLSMQTRPITIPTTRVVCTGSSRRADCTDNVLWSGKVLDAVQDEDTRAIAALNQKLMKDERIDLAMSPIGDGLTLCLVQANEDGLSGLNIRAAMLYNGIARHTYED